MSNYILSTGDTPTCGPNQTYRADVTWAGAKGQCLTDAQYAECKSGTLLGQPCSVSSSGGIVDAAKSVIGSIFGIWGQSKVAQGQAQAYQTMAQQQAAANATPSWLMPVAIGGAAIAVVLLLKKRKNPARGRRRNPARRRFRRVRRRRSR